MGIDITGGMIVGSIGSSIEVPESSDDDIYDYIENCGMETFAMHYDAELEDSYVGFPIEDILVSDIDESWVNELKEKADKFKKLTGADAELIGSPNVR
jgi:hypothetical protein